MGRIYGALQREYVIREDDQARREWKAKVEKGDDQDWWEEVESKSSLGCGIGWQKNEFGFKNYIGSSSQGQEAWGQLLGRRVVGMDRMATGKIENVIMAGVEMVEAKKTTRF